MGRWTKSIAVGTVVVVAVLGYAYASSHAVANRRAVLYSGVSSFVRGPEVVTDAGAVRSGRRARKSWLGEITRRARQDPSQRFPKLSERAFRRRLAAASSRYHFTVKEVRFLHPRQLAPFVVIETRQYFALADAVPAIEKSLFTVKRAGGVRDAFEGTFLEAVDERGVPFVASYGAVRGRFPMGGQWARADALYPYIRF